MLIKNYFRFLAILSLFLLFSCQSEIAEQLYNKQETITKSTPLTTYLQRVAMVNTVDDNLIDKSSYFTIKLPYKVTVDNTSIAINSTSDYQKVQDKININSNAVVKITFPVSIIFYDYTEKVINSQSEFDSLLAYWNSKPDLLTKINCLNITYPITINIYNSANQIASSALISTNQSLFIFINNLLDSQYVALSYPIKITDNNNQETSISTNSQLENAIQYAIRNCATNNNPSLGFNDVLTANSWKISYYYDEKEKTQSYNGYVFVFNSDKSVTATKSGITTTGQWSTKTDNGIREFKLSFSPDLLHQLDEDWKLFEFNSSQLRFRKEEGSNDNHYLYFEKK